MREIIKSFLLSLFFIPNIVFGAAVSYQGTILDENNEPLIGVNIASVSDATKGCSTDLDGKFTDCKLPDNKVKVSYVGYKTQTINLQESGNNIKLEPDIEELKEVQIDGDKNAMTQQSKDCIDSGGKMEMNGENTAVCVCPADKPLNGNKCAGEDNGTEPEGKIEENTTPVGTEPVIANEQPDGGEAGGNDNGSKNDNGNNNQGQTNKNDNPKNDDLADKKKAYEDAKANEQSLANRTLTAATTAATGIGGMELAMGLSEQKADKAAEQDMDAYLRTFRCTYGDGKAVKGGQDEIELPGGNIPELMNLRNEYVSLASSLKERKTSLGLKPGIEAEEIFDKATMGLYDDEFLSIDSGAYGSLYRAKALNNEEDQARLDADKKEAKNRVIAGGVLVGAGVVGGMLGNSLINGKLGEKIKEAKAEKEAKKKEADALKELKNCLDKAGVKNTSKLKFDYFTPSVLNLGNIDCSKDLSMAKGKDAQSLFIDSDNSAEVIAKLDESFSPSVTDKLVGMSRGCTNTNEEMDANGNCVPKSTSVSNVQQTTTNATAVAPVVSNSADNTVVPGAVVPAVSPNNEETVSNSESDETVTPVDNAEAEKAAKLEAMQKGCVPENTVVHDAYHEVDGVGFCYHFEYMDKEIMQSLCDKFNASLCEYDGIKDKTAYVCSTDCSVIPSNFKQKYVDGELDEKWKFLE